MPFSVWTRRAAAGVLLGLVVAGCGRWQRVGRETPAPDPSTYVSRLFDLTPVYRGMGLFAANDGVPFVASASYLGGPAPDSTLAVVAVSLAHEALSFRRADGAFEARYEVEVEFRRGGRTVHTVKAEERARVQEFEDTKQADPRLTTQYTALLSPGLFDVAVRVRDANSGTVDRAVGTADVPAFRAPRELSALVPVYRARGRDGRQSTDANLLVNARYAVPFGTDTLLLYGEAYGGHPDDVVTVWAVTRDEEPAEIWRDSVLLGRPRQDLTPVLLALRPSLLPIGELDLFATLRGGTDTVATHVLVTFSDQWAVGNLNETLSLLRYFGADRALAEIRAADPRDQAALWREFWEQTDPDQSTPEHEGFELYFARVQEANQRFAEPGRAGWLTDRGEVFISIGPPDDVYDSSSDLQDRGVRFVRWFYTGPRIQLDFQDETGFGEFRLTARSRSDYLRTLNRLRQGE